MKPSESHRNKWEANVKIKKWIIQKQGVKDENGSG
jgi:hypothetical protein